MSTAVARAVTELAHPDGLDLVDQLEAGARFEAGAVRRIRSLSDRVRALRRERDWYRRLLIEAGELTEVPRV